MGFRATLAPDRSTTVADTTDPATSTTTEPAWVEHAIWWQIYPLGFVGAPLDTGTDPESHAATEPAVVHRLDRIIGWLDYALELGVSGIALGPIFQSETHGYDTTDYFTIDPRLGDKADFTRLVTEAHSRGLRILLDGVFNHVGRSFHTFQSALSGDDSPEARWFTRVEGGSSDNHNDFVSFEGHSALVELNHAEPAVADFVTEVMTYWLALGADGWRLDAAYAVPPAFWATVLPRVQLEDPDVYIVGEVLHGDYSAFVTESRAHAVTQYELWKAIWSGVSEKNFFELAWSMDRHGEFLETFVPLTFVGNHDVTRIASAIPDERHLAHALVVLFTIGGTPSVYYGDEQGFRGVKEQRAGGDDAVRPEFPAEGPDKLSTLGWPIYNLHTSLIGLRRRHPWLHRAAPTQRELTNEFYAYEVAGPAASTDGEIHERLLVLLNLADKEHTTTAGSAGVLLLGEAAVTDSGVVVPAHGWAVVRLR
jgi:cyclomaltodextrinase